MLSIHTEMELRRNKNSAWDPDVFAARAKRSRRLAKSKPMLKPVIKKAMDRGLKDAPIQANSGTLEKQLRRVQLMRTRGTTIIYGVKVEYSVFYAAWRRTALDAELVPWDKRLAEDVTDVLIEYFQNGRSGE